MRAKQSHLGSLRQEMHQRTPSDLGRGTRRLAREVNLAAAASNSA